MKSVRSVFVSLVAAALLLAVTRASAADAPPAPTVIESAGPGEMVSTETETTFTFRDKVVVSGTNLKLTCELLVVVAKRAGDPNATLGKQENFKSLVATGGVRILQSDREATCDRAEIFPGEDKVVLSGNLKVRALDDSFVQTGPRGTLYRGQKRVVIESPRIVLPPLKDLGYEKEPEKPAPKADAEPRATEPAITLPNLGAPK